MSIVKSIELRHEHNGHSKFYRIDIHDEERQYLVKSTWGRIGKSPQHMDVIKGGPYASLEAASVHYQDLVLSKLKKGYKAYLSDDEHIPSPAPPRSPGKASSKTYWTKKDIDNNPQAFTQALKAALQKGVRA